LSLLGSLCGLNLGLELSLLSLCLGKDLSLELLLLLLLLCLKYQNLILELELQSLLVGVQAHAHSLLLLLLEHHMHHHLLLLLLELVRTTHAACHWAVHHSTRTHGAIRVEVEVLHLGNQVLIVFIDCVGLGKARDLERCGCGASRVGHARHWADSTGAQVGQERGTAVSLGLHTRGNLNE